ncbi:MAG: hydrogenase large subunit, partial [Candidatus Binatota bacterium]|nr:hydrogenase large subunit [Candidatus Binatota bacterium]
MAGAGPGTAERVHGVVVTSKEGPDGLVEMAWDPITRIVGSLGIHTKIDFNAGRVVEAHSTSSIFRGYSVF